MAETNSDDTAVDDSKIEEDLKKVKEDSKVETEEKSEADEKPSTEEFDKSEPSEEDGKTDDQADKSVETDSEFVKEFPNIKGDTLEEYQRNLEIAYRNSTSEALRLKGLAEAKPEPEEENEEESPSDPRLLYLDQMLQKDITDSFNEFSKHYPQTKDPEEYEKFQTEAANMSQYIMQTQKRVAPASELYSKVAVILDWKPETVVDDKDKLDSALKDRASQSKTTSATKPKSTSKITDAEIQIAKSMGGWTDGKSDAEIRKELELV